jgi:hypothetical protein
VGLALKKQFGPGEVNKVREREADIIYNPDYVPIRSSRRAQSTKEMAREQYPL